MRPPHVFPVGPPGANNRASRKSDPMTILSLKNRALARQITAQATQLKTKSLTLEALRAEHLTLQQSHIALLVQLEKMKKERAASLSLPPTGPNASNLTISMDRTHHRTKQLAETTQQIFSSIIDHLRHMASNLEENVVSVWSETLVEMNSQSKDASTQNRAVPIPTDAGSVSSKSKRKSRLSSGHQRKPSRCSPRNAIGKRVKILNPLRTVHPQLSKRSQRCKKQLLAQNPPSTLPLSMVTEEKGEAHALTTQGAKEDDHSADNHVLESHVGIPVQSKNEEYLAQPKPLSATKTMPSRLRPRNSRSISSFYSES